VSDDVAFEFDRFTECLSNSPDLITLDYPDRTKLNG
jgi:hypothetical protein